MSGPLAAVVSVVAALGAGAPARATSTRVVPTLPARSGVIVVTPPGTGWENPTGPQRAVAEAARAGARRLVVVVTWLADGTRASTVRPAASRTPSDRSVATLASAARRARMDVTLVPHVVLADGSWRGTWVPTDQRRWESSYGELVEHVARLARRNGADSMLVGSELAATSSWSARWRRLTARARLHFPGSVHYAANWDEVETITWWDALDSIGVDAYYPLRVPDPTNAAQLAVAWRPWVERLEAVAQREHRPILFTEAGYTTWSGTAAAPYDWRGPTKGARPAEEEQAAAYEALLRVWWDRPHFAGVWWWSWHDANYTPREREAERILQRWWRSAR